MRDRFIGKDKAKQTESERESERERESPLHTQGVSNITERYQQKCRETALIRKAKRGHGQGYGAKSSDRNCEIDWSQRGPSPRYVIEGQSYNPRYSRAVRLESD